MSDIGRNIWIGLTTASWLDQANLVFGLCGVALMIRRSLWAFPIGLIAVTTQGILFYQTHFPADATLQIFYFGALAWGWWHWRSDGSVKTELAITTMPPRERGLVLILASLATIGWALTIGPWMKAAMPWRDAFIAIFSVAAQILQVRKNVENWALWTAVNGVAIISYWSATLAYTAFLYAIYLGLGLLGWREWYRTMKGSQVAAPNSVSVAPAG